MLPDPSSGPPAPSSSPFLTALRWDGRYHASLLVAGLTVMTFGLDLATPVELTLSVFYLLPVTVASWRIGTKAGCATAIVAAALGFAGDRIGGFPYSQPAYFYWAFLERLVFFGAFALVTGRLRGAVSELLAQAKQDPLTGIYNRRGFFERAELEVSRARRYARPMSLAFFDIDDFKLINDHFGHATGDRVLAALGRGLGAGRATDVPARIGGDEFVILMPETDATAAEHTVERIRALVRAHLSEMGLNVGFTVGVIAVERPPKTVMDFVHAADALLYEAKKGTKDSIRTRTIPRSGGSNVIPFRPSASRAAS